MTYRKKQLYLKDKRKRGGRWLDFSSLLLGWV
jgi:hypothetical protein